MPRLIDVTTLSSRDTPALARSLIGAYLVRAGTDGSPEEARMITEVEAYDGPEDRASHASRGETPRNRVMFGPAGRWYVYLCYGVHEMLNLVTGPGGYPAAVLIRGVAGASGPGRLTRAMGIGRRFNGLPATRAGGLWIEDRGIVVRPSSIAAGPRVGVAYAGPVWSRRPWRFSLRGA